MRKEDGFPLLHSSFLLPTFPVLLQQTALRDSAFLQREASPQVVSEAKDNMAGHGPAHGGAVGKSPVREVPPPILAVGRQLLIMARTKPNVTNPSTAAIGFEATALRGIGVDVGPEHGNTFRRDLRRDMNRESVDWTQTYLRNQICKLPNMTSI